MREFWLGRGGFFFNYGSCYNRIKCVENLFKFFLKEELGIRLGLRNILEFFIVVIFLLFFFC